MAEYICIEDQGSRGCDYTIGCGVKVTSVEADSPEEAFKIFTKKCYWEDYFNGNVSDPRHLVSGDWGRHARIIEVGAIHTHLFQDAYQKALQIHDNKEKEETRQEEMQQLERLAKKLGKRVV